MRISQSNHLNAPASVIVLHTYTSGMK